MEEIKVETLVQYLVDGDPVSERRFYDLLEEAIGNSAEDMYDEVLDEQGDVELGGISYSRSHVWKAVDEIAYNCGYRDFVSSLLEDARYDLEHGQSVRYDMTDFEITEAELPSEIDINFDEAVINPDNCTLEELESGINDLISDEYGFCFSNYDLDLDKENKVAHVSNIEWTLD